MSTTVSTVLATVVPPVFPVAPDTAPDVLRAAALLTAALTHGEVVCRMESRRGRGRARDAIRADLRADVRAGFRAGACATVQVVWFFAAALLLPGLLSTVVIVVIQGHIWWRADRDRLGGRIFQTAAIVAASQVVSLLVRVVGGQPPVASGVARPTGLVLLALAAFGYWATTSALAAVASALRLPWVVGQPTGARGELICRISALCVGAFVAVAASSQPLMPVVAVLPALALHRIGLIPQLRDAASTDAKTGLLNYAGWQAHASRTLARIDQAHSSAYLAIIDLDRFKRVNDLYGHLAGDAVLQAVARVLRSATRGRDIVGRFGGEEFVVLLPHATVQDALAVARRIRQGVAVLSVGGHQARIADLTVSIGMSGYPGDGLDLEQVLEAADGALYQAKRDGRNRMVLATTTHGPDRRPRAAVVAGDGDGTDRVEQRLGLLDPR